MHLHRSDFLSTSSPVDSRRFAGITSSWSACMMSFALPAVAWLSSEPLRRLSRCQLPLGIIRRGTEPPCYCRYWSRWGVHRYNQLTFGWREIVDRRLLRQAQQTWSPRLSKFDGRLLDFYFQEGLLHAKDHGVSYSFIFPILRRCRRKGLVSSSPGPLLRDHASATA